ncbi:MAG: aldo/keto reductase [Anaerolineaceae bacterium]|nr:aldo/keto reductase [Anaerolineaceae bacterium]
MKYTTLGRTGVQVSRLCLGCMNFGGRTPAAEAEAIIAQAIDQGINFIDTANVYGHEPGNYHEGRGRSEQIVGEALHTSGKRAQIVLATKAHYPMHAPPNGGGNSRRHIIEQCHDSLRRLKTDWIDLYQLHAADTAVPIDETLRALDDLIRAGKVCYIGTSGFPAWKLLEALWVAKEYGLNRFVCEQPPYNLLDRRIERELLPMAQSYGLGIITWAPLAGGFLSGKYKPDAPVPDDSRFSEFWQGFGQEHYRPSVFAVVEALTAVAQSKNCSLAQLALAWQLHQPAITAPIIGPRTVAQLNDALGALAVELTRDALAHIDEVARPTQFVVSYYGGEDEIWAGWQPTQFHWL